MGRLWLSCMLVLSALGCKPKEVNSTLAVFEGLPEVTRLKDLCGKPGAKPRHFSMVQVGDVLVTRFNADPCVYRVVSGRKSGSFALAGPDTTQRRAPLAILGFNYRQENDRRTGHNATKQQLESLGYRVLDISNARPPEIESVIQADRAANPADYAAGQNITMVTGGVHGTVARDTEGRPIQKVLDADGFERPRMTPTVDRIIVPAARAAGVGNEDGPTLNCLATACFSNLVPQEIAARDDLKQEFGDRLQAVGTSPADSQGTGAFGIDQGLQHYLRAAANPEVRAQMDADGDGSISVREYSDSSQFGLYQPNYVNWIPDENEPGGGHEEITMTPPADGSTPNQTRYYVAPQNATFAGSGDGLLFADPTISGPLTPDLMTEGGGTRDYDDMVRLARENQARDAQNDIPSLVVEGFPHENVLVEDNTGGNTNGGSGDTGQSF